ncbi:condensation domain-containing protein, partial [Actinosynnema sp.]|uniref:condensation domain-containing protein n=1 Tax=Actinosynnema sp. TaxID=1872144 RepID=UPI003F867A97
PPLLRACAVREFALAVEQPIRAALFVTGPDEHVLLVVLHHIAADGWSMGPLSRDLATAYAARARGEAPAWAPLPVQYADYALWQRDLLGDEGEEGGEFARQVEHWRARLAGLPELITLPADRPRPARASHRGEHLAVELDAGLHARLSDLARASGATQFMVLQAGLAGLLTKLGAGEDVVIGSPIAGRTDEALDELVGFFVNTLVLRTDTSGDPSFTELVARVREGALEAYANQDVPFEHLVEVLNPARSLSHHPLLQVVLAVQNAPSGDFALPGLAVTGVPVPTGTSRLDLAISLAERRAEDGSPGGLVGAVEYSTDLFDRATVELLLTRWTRLLTAVTADPGLPLRAVDLLGGLEHRALADRNNTAKPVAGEHFAALFRAVADRTPGATAVVGAAEALTYAELDARANRFAHARGALGAGPEDGVALRLPRSVELVVAVLGVLKAGAAYLPVDPAYPAARIELMLADARCALVVDSPDAVNDPAGVLLAGGGAAGGGAVGGGAAGAGPVDTGAAGGGAVAGGPVGGEAGAGGLAVGGPVACGAAATDPVVLPDTDPRVLVRPENPAYVIYTSGSTGRPKGVVVTHGGVPSLVATQVERLALDPRSRVLQLASPSFDAAFWDLCATLLTGAALVLAPVDDPLSALTGADVTHATLPPSALASVDGEV